MADFREVQQQFTPDNRLTLDQSTRLMQRFMQMHGVSSMQAMRMVEDTQKQRQALINERQTKAEQLAKGVK
jgi:hypothetical protein